MMHSHLFRDDAGREEKKTDEKKVLALEQSLSATIGI